MGLFEASAPPTTAFEVAPNGRGGETFWIYEIDNPGEFFSGCETEQEALDRLIDSEKGPDERVETCGYTLVLDAPEDPPASKSVSPPEEEIVIEVLKGSVQNQKCEFYEIADPVDTFEDSWGTTTEMFRKISEEGIGPMLEYENVSLRFQRPYGAL